MKRYKLRFLDQGADLYQDPQGDYVRYEDVPRWISDYRSNVRHYQCDLHGYCKQCGSSCGEPHHFNCPKAKKPIWKSSEDSIPNHEEMILVTDGEILDIARFDKYKDCFIGLVYLEGDNITHWMPLPEPPGDDDD